ncbi:Uncharacterised protein [uncultured archaeon]|nr:Uncharacterised protein [uncultured archaeon]
MEALFILHFQRAIEMLDIFKRKPNVFPATEPVTNFDGTKLKRGRCYLIKEPKSDAAFGNFVSLVMGTCSECQHPEAFSCENIGCKRCTLPCPCKCCTQSRAQGLCFTIDSPEEIRQKYLLQTSPIFWISKLGNDSINPANLEIMAGMICDFFKKSKNPIVLLDGMEYSITINGFTPVFKFLHDVRELVILYKAVFILPVSPGTLDEKELALIERIMDRVDV